MEEEKGWSGGKVACDLCGEEWIAVYPAQIERLECPNCGNMVHYEEIETDENT